MRTKTLAIVSALALGALTSSAAVAYAALDCAEEPARSVAIHLEPKAPKASDPVALALALEEINRMPGEAQGAAYLNITRSWSGRTYRWEGAYVEPMCRLPSRHFSVPYPT